MSTPTQPVGELLRTWRQRRRRSQLDLALDAEVSARHLSFIETGRARPSREMILRLAERLAVPHRECNAILVSGGFAPHFPERSLDDPALGEARAAVDLILKGHEPYPALAVDRHWTMVAANAAVEPLVAGVADFLLTPPVNVMRLSLHPDGLAPRIVNLAEWRTHLLARLDHQISVSADPVLAALREDLAALPAPEDGRSACEGGSAGVAIPIRIATGRGVLSFISTTTVFGTPVDITLSELAIEAFFPADRETATLLAG